MAYPIFVIGKARSGTKWLTNMIAEHPDVACVQRPGAGGVLETNCFDRMPRVFGSLSYDDNHIAFIECFSATNFFLLTGLEKSMLYHKRCSTYYDFFRMLMDAYAEKEGKRFWVQKSSPSVGKKLFENYPDAKFVLIQRGISDNLKSAVGLEKRYRGKHFKSSILKHMYSYFLAGKRLERWRREPNAMGVRFEELRNERHRTVHTLCQFLGISYDESMMSDTFKKNTSFRGQISRETVLNRQDMLIIRLLAPLCARIPHVVYENLRRPRIGCNSKDGDSPTFVRKTFELKRRDIGWENNRADG